MQGQNIKLGLIVIMQIPDKNIQLSYFIYVVVYIIDAQYTQTYTCRYGGKYKHE